MCQGKGAFRLGVASTPVGVKNGTPVVCTPGGAAQHMPLGTLPGGTGLRFTFRGDAGMTFLVKVEAAPVARRA